MKDFEVRQKRSFYCGVCSVHLTSVEMRTSHVEGRAHKKRMSSKINNLMMEEGLSEEEAKMRIPDVIEVPNKTQVKKATTMKSLGLLIKESHKPVVGLEFIKEYLPETDMEMEPHYECSLCGSMGHSNCMLMHLLGGTHRRHFLAMKIGDYAVIELSKKEMENMVTRFSENKASLSSLMTTIRSDSRYPWPVGKAPWSEERGGSGEAPMDARENFGNGFFDGSTNTIKQEAKESLFHLETQPSTDVESLRMAEMGSSMIRKALDNSTLSWREKQLMKSVLSSVVLKLTQNLTEIKSAGEMEDAKGEYWESGSDMKTESEDNYDASPAAKKMKLERL